MTSIEDCKSECKQLPVKASKRFFVQNFQISSPLSFLGTLGWTNVVFLLHMMLHHASNS